MTLAELEARVNQLSNRVSALASSAQITELRTLLNTYKAEIDAHLTRIQGQLDTHETRLNDHENRLQALEA